MRSCINRALTYNPDTNARWIPQDEAQTLVDQYRPLADTYFVNPEGVYEDELHAYLSGKAKPYTIDNTFVWRQQDETTPPGGNIVTESLHYDLFDAPHAKHNLEKITEINFDFSDKTTVYFLRSVFADSQRKGIYIPSLYAGWHMTILPYIPDTTPKGFLGFLNRCDWNRDVTKVTMFRNFKDIDISKIFPTDTILRMTPIQQERLYHAHLITFKSEPLELYKEMEKKTNRRHNILFC